MTKLASKSERDSLNIDTFERAIVYSGLLLYKTLKDPNNPIPEDNNPFSDFVSYSMPNGNSKEITFTINVTLPIDRIEATELGGNFIETIGVYGTTDPNPIEIQCSKSSSDFISIKEEPDYIDTLEKYFAWLCHVVKSQLIKNESDEASRITTQFFVDNETPQLRIRVQNKINYENYLFNNNLLCSVKPLLENDFTLPDYGDDESSESSSILNNDATMNNEFIMDNGGSTDETSLTINNNMIMDNELILENN